MSHGIEFTSELSVKLMQQVGNDAGVVAAARVSTIGPDAFTDVDENAGLIDFLLRRRHGSAFEHNLFTFAIEAPIFVSREHVRHRVGWSMNEMSGRYTKLRPKFFVPPRGRAMRRVEGTKVGDYDYEPDEWLWHRSEGAMWRTCTSAWAEYEELLEKGVVPEVARSVLPVNVYSAWYATCNARSLMHYLGLWTERPAEDEAPEGEEWARDPSKPMWEIEQIADQMEAAFAEVMPLTHASFVRHGRVAP